MKKLILSMAILALIAWGCGDGDSDGTGNGDNGSDTFTLAVDNLTDSDLNIYVQGNYIGSVSSCYCNVRFEDIPESNCINIEYKYASGSIACEKECVNTTNTSVYTLSCGDTCYCP